MIWFSPGENPIIPIGDFGVTESQMPLSRDLLRCSIALELGQITDSGQCAGVANE